MLESINIQQYFSRFLSLVQDHIYTSDFGLQFSLIGVALLLGAFVRKRFNPKIMSAIDESSLHYATKKILRNISRLILHIVALTILLLAGAILKSGLVVEFDLYFLNAATALLLAWIVIRFIVQVIDNSMVRNMFAMTIWGVTALAILGVLDQTTSTLDSAGVNIGEFRISALSITKGTIALFILLYSALFVARLLERQVQKTSGLTLSSKVLISKIIRVTLVATALIIGITSAGVDLSLFAVFGGAIGLGVGFGLQKGISNLFSGMMLLMDKSIKPGDILELPGNDGVFGWVAEMGARYTEIVTRDNKSFLIPNEDFITQQVINWSHGDDTLVRVETSFGVHYDSDPHEVKRIAQEAALTPERVQEKPAPVCHLVEFGDSSINFVLRYWIKDAQEGVTNTKGGVMLALWDAFKENGIEIPYPQREVYIKENVAPHTAPDKIVKIPKEKEETIEAEKPKNDNAEE
jgi:small-conductance mechanosensitive channel